MRDAFLVYFSVISGYFIIGQLNPVIKGGSVATQVFTDNPGF